MHPVQIKKREAHGKTTHGNYQSLPIQSLQIRAGIYLFHNPEQQNHYPTIMQAQAETITKPRFIPTLFSSLMVKAILRDEEPKTVTRRVIKLKKKIKSARYGFTIFTPKDENGKRTHFSVRGIHEDGTYRESFFPLKYRTGDILWVRETSFYFRQGTGTLQREKTKYRADERWDGNKLIKWIPSIFMPKDVCRIFLQVTDVRIEPLQDISESDARREGVMHCYAPADGRLYCNYLSKTKGRYDAHLATAKESFQTLWMSINGEQSWKDNPHVYAISFKRIPKPDNFI